MGKLKEVRDAITLGTNIFLSALLYVFGVSICFFLNLLRRREKDSDTYWKNLKTQINLSKQY